MELGLIVVVALVVFGGGRIASLGKGLGQGIKNFKSGLKDGDEPPPEPEAKKA
jgi:sec-independent protein translocase protein TatA